MKIEISDILSKEFLVPIIVAIIGFAGIIIRALIERRKFTNGEPRGRIRVILRIICVLLLVAIAGFLLRYWSDSAFMINITYPKPDSHVDPTVLSFFPEPIEIIR